MLISVSFDSCGFAYKKHIVGKYYIIGVDTKDNLSLCYELTSGDYVGKVPSRIIGYSYNKTFLVAKVQEYRKTHLTYYVIDMTRDSEFAHEEDFRVGPLSEKEFESNWKSNLKMVDVK
jgi:hypothetical protein